MIIFTLLLGLVLRFISLNQSLWIDEATTMNVARSFPFGDIINKFSPGDFHPPFYYLFMKVWVDIFGSSEIVGRMPSIIFGVLTIYVIYLIGRNIIDKQAGIVAGLLLATSGLHIYYSQEARMYSMTAFLVSCLIFSFVKILKSDRVGNWLVFGVLIALIGMTDYVALLILPVFWIYGIIYRKDKIWFSKLVGSHIILGVFAAAWLPIFLRQFNSGLMVSPISLWAQSLGIFSLKEILLIPIKFMIGRVGFDDKLLYGLIVTLVSLLFGYLIFKSRREVGKLKLVWMWLIVPIGLGILISIKIPILNYFRFLFVLPALYLILASGLQSIKNKRVRVTLLVIVVALNLFFSGIYLFNKNYWREDWRSAALFIGHNVVIFPAESQREAYLYYNPDAKIVEPNDLGKREKEVFLIRYAQPISDPSDLTRKTVEGLGYKMQQELDFNGVVVWRYGSN